ncbi:magnesium transporter, partial [Phenoliferia sp. Uapishka_3]
MKGQEDKPAWWLDVMCPTVADMRALRKVLPLHPLTMEDILHQETREKVESFSSLGYYFIVFRALDETYFQYTSTDQLTPEEDLDPRKRPLPGSSSGRKGRVDIIEGVGGKEGVEGVGVGAVNIYLVVFPDGILSFHFEDISKHSDRVQGKLQQFGLSRSMSSHWIAYGLMDSIVDAFFPLIDFIEGETKEVDAFLSDPLSHGMTNVSSKVAPSGVGVIAGRRVYDENVIGIVVEPTDSCEPEKENGNEFKRATVFRSTTTSVLRGFSSVKLSTLFVRVLPVSWVRQAPSTEETIMLVDAAGFMIPTLEGHHPLSIPLGPGFREGDKAAAPAFDRLTLLKRIADARKLVTGLSRLLGTKADVVRGLRKRLKDEDEKEGRKMFGKGDQTNDIAIYFGDLFDHIVAMQKVLNFYDSILSHDHPAFIGVLRLSLTSAKAGTDTALVKLYIVTLTFLPINILTGMFSLNIEVPHNGSRDDHTKADGSPAGYHAFYGVLGGVVFVALTTWFLIWLIFKTSKKQVVRRGSPTR